MQLVSNVIFIYHSNQNNINIFLSKLYPKVRTLNKSTQVYKNRIRKNLITGTSSANLIKKIIIFKIKIKKFFFMTIQLRTTFRKKKYLNCSN